jgi:hypothetical protein
MMAITAEQLFNVVSGRKIADGTLDKSVNSFKSLSEENKKWWEKKAKIVQQIIDEDNGKK